MKGEFFPLDKFFELSFSRSTTRFRMWMKNRLMTCGFYDRINCILEKAECTTENVNRLWPGLNCLRVVLKPKYCCRVVMSVPGMSLISASINKISMWSEQTRINFANRTKRYSVTILHLHWFLFTRNWNEKIRFNETKYFLLMLSRFSFIHIIITNTNCSSRYRKLFSFKVNNGLKLSQDKSELVYCLKDDVYIASLWILVSFGAKCDS